MGMVPWRPHLVVCTHVQVLGQNLKPHPRACPRRCCALHARQAAPAAAAAACQGRALLLPRRPQPLRLRCLLLPVARRRSSGTWTA